MSHNPCESLHEKIAALAIGEIETDEATEVLSHLETCVQCQGLYQEMVQDEVFVQAAFGKIRNALQPGDVAVLPADRALPAVQASSVTASRVRMRRWKWTPMKVTALAAVIVLAATGLLSRLSLISPTFGATFAAVIQRVQKARTVTYKRIVHIEGQEPQELQEMAMYPGCLRTVWPTGWVRIRDFAQGKEISIDPAAKLAELVYKTRHDKERLAHLLEWLAGVHETDGVFVGQQDLNGRKTNLFRVSQPFEETVIWADAQTDLPVRIERVLDRRPNEEAGIPDIRLALSDFYGPDSPERLSGTVPTVPSESRIRVRPPGVREQRVEMSMSDFAWDIALDESIFEVAAPPDYEVIEMDYGSCLLGEEALTASLRFWAETSDGAFPDDINILSEVRAKLIRKFRRVGPAEQDYVDALKMANVVANGMLFALQMKALDNWHYDGKNVKFGQRDRPLCWWKVEGTATCRVVYGDLTARDMPAAEMPQIEGR